MREHMWEQKGKAVSEGLTGCNLRVNDALLLFRKHEEQRVEADAVHVPVRSVCAGLVRRGSFCPQ